MSPEPTRLIRWRHCLLAAVLTAAASLAPGATTDPGRTLRFIVGGNPGSAPDLLARRLVDPLSTALGRTVIVLNRPGAGGMIALEAVAQAKDNGDTIGLATMSQLVFNSYVFSNLRYDPLRDITPVATISTGPMIIAAHPQFEARSFQALLELAKKRPGEIRFATPGTASPPRIVLAVISSATGARFDVIPFKSDLEALTNVLNGEVPLLITAPAIAASHIQSGKLNGIAVTSRSRVAALSNVPSIAESGHPDFDVETWVGVVAPSGTPSEYVEHLNQVIGRIIAAPEFVTYAQSNGVRITVTSPEQFSRLIREAHARWGPLLESVRPEIR